MQYVCFGNSGLKVFWFCLGCMIYGDLVWCLWVLDEEWVCLFICEVLEVGIDFFDSVDIYFIGESEWIFGCVFRDFVQCEDLVIVIKVFFFMSDRFNVCGLLCKYLFVSVDVLLWWLGMDYLDFFVIYCFDLEILIEEICEIFDSLVCVGKVCYFGVLLMLVWCFMKMFVFQCYYGLV